MTADRVARQILDLDEPWRGRFLDWTARLATGGAWDGVRPGRDDLVGWLAADLVLGDGCDHPSD